MRIVARVIYAAVLLFLGSAGGFAFGRHKKKPADQVPPKPAVTATQPPVFSIPVESLGFYPPGPFYLGQRETLVSLDFLDEDRLLFTFRAPGLIRRSNPATDDERQIRAEVLLLPQGTEETEALWKLHGDDRYLWMLRNGHFLLRDQNTLREGDASLALKPILQFPGPLTWLEMDPEKLYLVTDSNEPANTRPMPGQVGSPETAQANMTTDADQSGGQPDIVVRILRRSSGQVMLVSRVRMTVHLPINSDGYLETLRGSGRTWVLNLAYFTGGNRILGRVESACEPPAEFLTKTLALINTCVPDGGRDLIAITTDGTRLWDAPQAPTQVWPLLVRAPDGSKVVRETITLDHAVDGYANMIDAGSMKGQIVEVLDSKTGKQLLKAPASPLLDGGGNVAISPSGNRVAILNEGAIQVYQIGDVPSSGSQKP